MDSLGIESYGISITTLEEVFLNINHEFNTSLGMTESLRSGSLQSRVGSSSAGDNDFAINSEDGIDLQTESAE